MGVPPLLEILSAPLGNTKGRLGQPLAVSRLLAVHQPQPASAGSPPWARVSGQARVTIRLRARQHDTPLTSGVTPASPRSQRLSCALSAMSPPPGLLPLSRRPRCPMRRAAWPQKAPVPRPRSAGLTLTPRRAAYQPLRRLKITRASVQPKMPLTPVRRHRSLRRRLTPRTKRHLRALLFGALLFRDSTVRIRDSTGRTPRSRPAKLHPPQLVPLQLGSPQLVPPQLVPPQLALQLPLLLPLKRLSAKKGGRRISPSRCCQTTAARWLVAPWRPALDCCHPRTRPLGGW